MPAQGPTQIFLAPGHEMDRPDPRDVIKDPEFHTLPMNDRIQMYSQADPDFKSLHPPDQMDIMQRAEQEYGKPGWSHPDLMGAGRNFLEGMSKNLNPMNIVHMGNAPPPGYPQGGWTRNAFSNIAANADHEFGKAQKQWNQGNAPGALAYGVSSALPFGPSVSHAVERGFGLNHDTGNQDPNVSPDPAGGLGEGAGIIGPAILGKMARSGAGKAVGEYGREALAKQAGLGSKHLEVAGEAGMPATNPKSIKMQNDRWSAQQAALDPSKQFAGAPPAPIKYPDFEPSLRGQPGYNDPLSLIHDVRAAAKNLADTRGKEYQEQLSQIPQNPLDTTKQRTEFLKDLAAEHGVKIKPPASQTSKLAGPNGQPIVTPGSGAGRLVLNSSSFGGSEGLVQRAFKDMMEWDSRDPNNTTPTGLDHLKRRLSDYYERSLNDGKATEASRLILKAKNHVIDTLNQTPGYRDMTSKYAAASEFMQQVDQELSTKEGSNPGTIVRKLSGALNQNNEYRQVVLDVLSNETGKDLIGRTAGMGMHSPFPRGIGGTIRASMTGLGIGAAGPSLLHHPELIPIALGGAMSTSPRVLGEAFNAISKLRRNHVPQSMRDIGTAAYDTGRLVHPQPQHDDSGPPGPALAPPSSLPNQGSIQQ